MNDINDEVDFNDLSGYSVELDFGAGASAPSTAPVGSSVNEIDGELDYETVTAQNAQYNEDTGVVERAGQRLHRGVLQSRIANNRVKAGELFQAEDRTAQQFERSAEQHAAFDPSQPASEDNVYTPRPRAYRSGQRRDKALDLIEQSNQDEDTLSGIPRSRLTEFVMESENLSQVFERIGIDPFGFAADIALTSLPASTESLLKGSAGSVVAGPVGAMVGGGVGSGQTDFRHTLLANLQEEGVDLRDPEQVEQAFLDNDLMDRLKRDAGKRAAVVGIADGLSFGLAAAPGLGSTLVGKSADVLARSTAGAVLGGAGEAGGELARGRKPAPGEVVAEVIGEFAQTPAEMAVTGTRKLLGKSETKSKTTDTDPDVIDYHDLEKSLAPGTPAQKADDQAALKKDIKRVKKALKSATSQEERDALTLQLIALRGEQKSTTPSTEKSTQPEGNDNAEKHDRQERELRQRPNPDERQSEEQSADGQGERPGSETGTPKPEGGDANGRESEADTTDGQGERTERETGTPEPERSDTHEGESEADTDSQHQELIDEALALPDEREALEFLAHYDPDKVIDRKAFAERYHEHKQERDFHAEQKQQAENESTKPDTDTGKKPDAQQELKKAVDKEKAAGKKSGDDQTSKTGKATLPDTPTAEEAHADPIGAAVRSALDLWRSGRSIIANAISQDFIDHGSASLVGQEIKTTTDLAVLGQVYRNPSYELLRVFVVDANKQVIYQNGVTNRLPSIVWPGPARALAWYSKLNRTLNRNPGSKVYFLHNHPAGDPNPSSADKEFTRDWNDLLNNRLGGHVVINNNQFAVLDKRGRSIVKALPKKVVQQYTAKTNPTTDHDLLGTEMTGTNALAAMGKALQKADTFQVVGYSGGSVSGSVSGIAEFPHALLSLSPARLDVVLRQFARTTGSYQLSIVNLDGKALSSEQRQRVSNLSHSKSIEHIVTPDGALWKHANHLLIPNEFRPSIHDAHSKTSSRSLGEFSADPVKYPLINAEVDPIIDDTVDPEFDGFIPPEGVSAISTARIKRSKSKFRTWMQRNWSTRGLVPQSVHELKIAADGYKGAFESEISFLLRSFEKAAAKAYGKRWYNQIEQRDLNEMNAYITGNPFARLKPEVKVELDAMRGLVDTLSGEIVKSLNELSLLRIKRLPVAEQKKIRDAMNNGTTAGIPKEILNNALLASTITNNMGEYLNQSYRAFDDPNWKDTVLEDKKLMALARRFIAKQNPKLTPGEVNGAIGAILQEAHEAGNFVSFIKTGTKYGAKDVSIFKSRKEISPVIMALLGVHRDPKLNFARSVSKMSYMVANHHFLMGMYKEGINHHLFERPTDDFKAKIVAKGNHSLSPLDGLYTTPEIKQGLEDLLDKFLGTNFMASLIRMNSAIKYGKTAIAPTTVWRNFYSAAGFTIMNGHFDYRHAVKAMHVAKSDLFSKDQVWKDYVGDLVKRGVLHDNPYSEELRLAMQDVLAQDSYAKGLTQNYRRFLGITQSIYRTGDDFWKIIGYENELARWIKRGMPEEEAKAKAAYRIRNGYPTYSQTPRAIKQLRRWPLIGTFVSFPSEIVRTTYNQGQFIKEDWQDGHKRLAGARVAGMFIMMGMPAGLSYLSMAMLGYDSDDDEAIRSLLPHWQRNAQLWYMDPDEDGLPQYFDMSHMDAYTYNKKWITALMSDNNQGLDKKILDASIELASPFLGPDIAAGAAGEIILNKKFGGGEVYNTAQSGWAIAGDMLEHFWKAVRPGVFGNRENMAKAINDESTVFGKQYTVRDETYALFGFRFGTLNVRQSLLYRAYEFADTLRDATRIMSQKATDRSSVSEKELRQAFNAMVRSRNEAFSGMIKLVKNARKIGIKEADLARALKAARISNANGRALLRGEIPKWRVSRRFNLSATERAILSSANKEREASAKELMIIRRKIVRELALEHQRSERMLITE